MPDFLVFRCPDEDCKKIHVVEEGTFIHIMASLQVDMMGLPHLNVLSVTEKVAEKAFINYERAFFTKGV